MRQCSPDTASCLSQPLLEGGALKHRRITAAATYKITAVEYLFTVLTAFQNMADSLYELRYNADAVLQDRRSEQTILSALEIARKPIALGGPRYLSLLSAESNYPKQKAPCLPPNQFSSAKRCIRLRERCLRPDPNSQRYNVANAQHRVSEDASRHLTI